MEKLKDLRALLVHEIQDVYSAEEQIIEALPEMIDTATNEKLKAALKDHLKVTRTQKQRLDKVQQLLKVGEDEKGKGKKGGLFGLFGAGHKCKGTQGIIQEGQAIMQEDINEEVLDAAIIASCQKIEHYEICAYGTLKAYAEALGLTQVAKLLNETLEEEYEADVLLTELAVTGGLNEKAETLEGNSSGRSAAESRGSSPREGRTAPSASNSRSSASPGKSAGAKKSGGSAHKTSSSKSNSSASKSRKTASSRK